MPRHGHAPQPSRRHHAPMSSGGNGKGHDRKRREAKRARSQARARSHADRYPGQEVQRARLRQASAYPMPV